MDESSISYGYRNQAGYKVSRRWCPDPLGNLESKDDKANARGSFSLVAFITDRPECQKLLPQFIIGNTHKLTLAVMAAWAARGPHSNLRVLRQNSAWNGGASMRQILTILKACLPGFVIVLVLDVASSHIDQFVAAHASRLGIRLVFVPALCTFCLQPLDVAVFACLKQMIRMLFQQALIRAGGASVDTLPLLELVAQAVLEVLVKKTWQKAFHDTGIAAKQQHISASTYRKLGISAGELHVPPGLPDFGQLSLVFPRNRRINAARYFRYIVRDLD